MPTNILEKDPLHESEFEEEVEEDQKIESWDDWESDEQESPSTYLCLFCDTRFDSSENLFDHCKSQHFCDFHGVVKDLGLDFYGSMKFINFIRTQVAADRCWGCGLTFPCKNDLLSHLHAPDGYEKDGQLLWQDDMYLKPFMVDDELLHSFVGDEEDDEDYNGTISKEEAMRELMNSEEMAEICRNGNGVLDGDDSENGDFHKLEKKEDSAVNADNGTVTKENLGERHQKTNDERLRISFANVAAREIKNVNENYFGAYGSFGIHREMISDKVRTDAYRDAILCNPSLLKQATVLDVGCGTGILSCMCIWQTIWTISGCYLETALEFLCVLNRGGSIHHIPHDYTAQAGASRVIAVEASAKMASVATQIAKDNGFVSKGGEKGEEKQCSGLINVVQTMVEDLGKCIQIKPDSIDVLISEWMGYCLLYESMLSSVLYARDHWLKPGGAILPDTATIFIAGFGKGGTSLPFWENVYGFNMSCIGKEVVEDAARAPIVDVVDSRDIVTESATLKFFDLTTMRPDDIDFTATAELELKSNPRAPPGDEKTSTCWCHGIVLWFDTGFTSRFCKETPIVLSTSPYNRTTHWSQTIFTFQEPIAMALPNCISNPAGALGTDDCPVVRIRSRISIARSSQHRSIDISMETTGISSDGRKRSWPVQIFNL